MLRDIKGTQRLPRLIALSLLGAATPVVVEGKNDFKITRTGVGVYAIVFAKPFGRAPVIAHSSLDGLITSRLEAVSAQGVTLKTFDRADGTTAKDGLANLIVLGWETPDQN